MGSRIATTTTIAPPNHRQTLDTIQFSYVKTPAELMTAGFLAACGKRTIYDLDIGQRINWLRMLDVQTHHAYRLAKSGMRCDCGRYASALARYELLIPLAHMRATTMYDWLCCACAVDADPGMEVIWVAR